MNFSDIELKRMKKFLEEFDNMDMDYIVEMIESELERRGKDDTERILNFKKDMQKYIGRAFRIRYDGYGDLHICYHYIKDLIIPDGCLTPYNVLIIGEELALFKNSLEYKEWTKDEKQLRLDNIDIVQSEHNEVEEVSLEQFENLKSQYSEVVSNMLKHNEDDINKFFNPTEE